MVERGIQHARQEGFDFTHLNLSRPFESTYIEEELTEFEGDLFVGCYLGFLYRPLDPLADADRCSAAKMALTTNLLFAWLMVLTTEEYRTINLIGLTTLPDELKYIADAFETRIGAFVAELGVQRGLPAVMQWLERNFKSLLCEMRDAYNDFLILEPRRPTNPHRNTKFKSRANFKQRTSACPFSISGTLLSPLDSRMSSGSGFHRAQNSFQSSNLLRELAVSGVGQPQSTLLPGYMPMSKKFAPSTANVAQPPSAPGLAIAIQDISTNQKRCASGHNAPALSGTTQARVNREQFRNGQPLGSGASPLDIGSRNSGDSEIRQVYFHCKYERVLPPGYIPLSQSFAAPAADAAQLPTTSSTSTPSNQTPFGSHQKLPTGSVVPLPSYISQARTHWLPSKRSREDDSDPAEGHSAKRRKVERSGMNEGGPKPSAAAASGFQRIRAYKLGAILPGKMRMSRKFAAPINDSDTFSTISPFSMPRKIVSDPVPSNQVAFGSHQELPAGSVVPLPSYISQVRAHWLPSKRSREADSDPAEGRNAKRREVDGPGMNEGRPTPSAAAASGIQRIRAYRLGAILPGKMPRSKKFAAPVDGSFTLSTTLRLSAPRQAASNPGRHATASLFQLPLPSGSPSTRYVCRPAATSERQPLLPLASIPPRRMSMSEKLAALADDVFRFSATARLLMARRTGGGSKRHGTAKLSKIPIVSGSSSASAGCLLPATSERQPLLPAAPSSKGGLTAKRFSGTSDFLSNHLDSHLSKGHPSAPASSKFASSATYTSWASTHLLPARRGEKENRKPER
ncbi:hypothetical protein HWV62_45450 [Athelia sp. TMB]|nr:hypothetical protein HWV62_45450 [Athelia sp. TMB]